MRARKIRPGIAAAAALAVAGMVLVALAGLAIIFLEGRQRRSDARLTVSAKA